MPMETRNPDYAARVRAIVEGANFTHALGLQLAEVTPGRCVTTLAVRPDHWQQDGYVHAGVQATLCDHTGGSAAYSLVAPEDLVLTVEFKINLLRPGIGEHMRCEAEVLRAGRSIVVSEAWLYAGAGGDGDRLCAKATVTLAVANTGE